MIETLGIETIDRTVCCIELVLLVPEEEPSKRNRILPTLLGGDIVSISHSTSSKYYLWRATVQLVVP
jgi:hypothetical protein